MDVPLLSSGNGKNDRQMTILSFSGPFSLRDVSSQNQPALFVKHNESASAISKAAAWIGVVEQLAFGCRVTSASWHFNMIGTLKVYARMHALKVRRSLRRRRNRRALSVKSNAWVVTLDSPRNGLFAHLSWCLAIWARAEKFGRPVSVRAVSPQYGRTDATVDWFKAHFLNRRPALEKSDQQRLILAEYEEWPDYEKGDGLTSIAEASALFYKYSGLQPGLLADVDDYCSQQWGTDPVLGVHYRGTDKYIEAPPVSFEKMIGHVREALALWPELRTVFVASDEENFPRALRATFPGHRVVFVDGILRSRNGCPVHRLFEPNGLKRAHEAVLDCLILSRTSLLLKTASMLSGWSAILSPSLPVILVNPPHQHANFFPDCVLGDRIDDLPARVALARSNYLAASNAQVA